MRTLPPGGAPLARDELRRLVALDEPARRLREGLEALLGAPVRLARSGREALRGLLVGLAARSGRREVVVPAYTCFSVPAAAVAAGLRVRLVEVAPDGTLDPEALGALPLERAAALVVSNLFGVPEALAPIRQRLAGSGVTLIDDAAQGLGGEDPEGPVGGRGEPAILSFGRGKPLEGLGGGAAVLGEPGEAGEGPEPGAGARLPALLAAFGYRLATSPGVYGWVASAPGLGVGETVFDPDFPHGAIRGWCAALAAARIPSLEARRRERAGEAERMAAALPKGLEPIMAPRGCKGAYPRLAVRARDADTRDRVLRALGALGAGAGRLYPAPLDRVPGLAPHRVGEAECPGAAALCERLFTLPTHARWTPAQRERILDALHEIA